MNMTGTRGESQERALDRHADQGSAREIVFVGAAPRPSTGGEKYGWEVIQELARRARVETVAPEDLPADARGYLASNRWLVGRYGDRLNRLTVVEDHFWHPRTFMFNWLARWRGAAVVVIVHHLYHRLRPRLWQRWVDRGLEFLALAAAHRIVVNSVATADEVSALGIPRGRMVVIRPGVDRLPEPARPAAPGPSLRLLSVGNVTPRKGLDVLLEALREVPFPFQLEIVGDPEYDARYRRRLDAVLDGAGLRGRVTLRGRVSAAELEAAYRRADAFVAPSRWEGFGMALLDALLYGLPVVASRVGAIPELVADGENGLLVPPGDAPALRAALARLASDEPLRRRMGERGRDRGVTLARTWDRVAADVATVVMAASPRVSR